MEVIFELNPPRSLCGVAFSNISLVTAKLLLGEPDEVEIAENNAFDEASTAYHFNSSKISLFFEEERLVCVAVSDPNIKLFGEQVMKLNEEELIYLFRNNGFPDHEIDKDWGEKQLVFEKAGVTVFFDNQKVSELFIDA